MFSGRFWRAPSPCHLQLCCGPSAARIAHGQSTLHRIPTPPPHRAWPQEKVVSIVSYRTTRLPTDPYSCHPCETTVVLKPTGGFRTCFLSCLDSVGLYKFVGIPAYPGSHFGSRTIFYSSHLFQGSRFRRAPILRTTVYTPNMIRSANVVPQWLAFWRNVGGCCDGKSTCNLPFE